VDFHSFKLSGVMAADALQRGDFALSLDEAKM
jgi:hypothetical protein